MTERLVRICWVMTRTRDPKSTVRMILGFIFPLLLAGVAHIIISMISPGALKWAQIFQVSVVAGLIGYIVSSVYERGVVYPFIIIVIVSVAVPLLGRLFGQPGEKWLLQALYMMAFLVGFSVLIIAGDRLGKTSLWMRALAGSGGGILAGVIAGGIIGAATPAINNFWLGIYSNLPLILELGLAIPAGILLMRLIAGRQRQTKQEEDIK